MTPPPHRQLSSDAALPARWLISTAQDQGRVILTSDRFLITAAISERAYFVRR